MALNASGEEPDAPSRTPPRRHDAVGQRAEVRDELVRHPELLATALSEVPAVQRDLEREHACPEMGRHLAAGRARHDGRGRVAEPQVAQQAALSVPRGHHATTAAAASARSHSRTSPAFFTPT